MHPNLVIIGAGPGGYVTAVRAAQAGFNVTIIEKTAVGGTCLNNGCIPSKILKHTADLLETFQHADAFGIRCTTRPEPDMVRLMDRKNTIIRQQRQGITNLLAHHHITHITGTACIGTHHTITVTEENGSRSEIPWDKMVLAPGTVPAPLPFLPFDGDRILSSDHLLSLETLPASMAIVGGGVIGCEFAFILSSLGVEVTLVEAMPRLLPLSSVDDDISQLLQREMKKRKIRMHLNHTVSGVDEKNGLLCLHLKETERPGVAETQETTEKVNTEKMLVCIGRMPHTQDLGLGTIGVDTDDKGWIRVDSHMQTNIPNVYAVGDILGPTHIMLAHVAWAEGQAAARHMAGNPAAMNYDHVPTVIFTSPEIGCAGLTEAQAKERGIHVRIDKTLVRTIGKAHVSGMIAGELKLISDMTRGKIVGIHMIGPHADDLIAEGVLAIKMGATAKDLAETIHAHPTLSEILYEGALKATGNPLHG